MGAIHHLDPAADSPVTTHAEPSRLGIPFRDARRLRLDIDGGGEVEVVLASGWARIRGLMGQDGVPLDGILIPRCDSVHTFWMRIEIDVVFCEWAPSESRIRVLEVREAVGGRRLVALPLRGRAAKRSRIATLEMASRAANERGIGAGVELRIGG